MKNRIALSLLIVSSAFTHTMENDTWSLSCFSLRSYLPAWLPFSQTPQESKLTSNIRKSKNELRSLLIDLWVEQFEIEKDYSSFLCYCYYPKNKELENLNHLNSLPSTLKNWRAGRVNGYSALGAAIISDKTSIEEKRNFIQKLLKNGFRPTTKDIRLAQLALYDGITKHKALLHVLYSQANWATLPQEIRSQIAQYMIQLFKNEFWLLPENYLQLNK